jgi:hypothetical protein
MLETYRVTPRPDGTFAVEHRMPEGGWRALKRTYPSFEAARHRAADLNLRYRYSSEATEWRPPGRSRNA